MSDTLRMLLRLSMMVICTIVYMLCQFKKIPFEYSVIQILFTIAFLLYVGEKE